MAVVQRPLNGRWKRAQHLQRTPRAPRMLHMLATALFIVALTMLVQRGIELGERRLNDWQYGFPRTASVSSTIGPEQARVPSLWVQTINLNGQITMLVIREGNTSQMQVIQGPYLVGSDGIYTVALPRLADVNADSQSDLVVAVRGELFIYINDAGTFRPITAAERATLVEGGYGT